MKKMSIEHQARIRAAGHRRWLRTLSRKSRTYIRAELLKVVPPSILSFRENFKETLRFIDDLRTATLSPSATARRSVYVDLVPVQRLSVPVAIVLAAEFHRWSLIKKVRLSPRNSSRWRPDVRALLSDLGVFELLGSGDPIRRKDVLNDHFTLSPLESGERFDGQKVDELQSHFAQILAGFTRKPQLFEGLMEAAENAISHAYPDDYEPTHPYAGHRWWGASCLDLSEMRLRFFIYDQGAGIPFTLPRGPLYERILAFVAQNTGGLVSDDAHMLSAAFEVGRTRTGLGHRGLGLQRMAEVVRGSEPSFLRIISGKAELIHHHNDRIESRGLPSHIGGTLIEWSMPADVFQDGSEDRGHEEN